MGVHNPDQYHIPEFKSFQHFVCEWLPKQDVESLDFIFRPQWMFVCDGVGKVMVDHLGRVETMNKTVALLSAELGRHISVKNENSTWDAKRDYRAAYLHSEMVDIIRHIYSRDVELFGYDFEMSDATI